MWTCRSIRIQKVKWDADGLPLAGYPMDPGVAIAAASGDAGSTTGWGASRSGTEPSGVWVYDSASSLENTRSFGESGRRQTFRGDADWIAWNFSVEVEGQEDGAYGMYALYQDPADYVEGYLDQRRHMFCSGAVIAGADQGLHCFPLRYRRLPGGRGAVALRTIAVEKSADREFAFSVDGQVIEVRTVALDRGQAGVFTVDAGARFRNVTLRDASFTWGDAFGDAAQGWGALGETAKDDGYVHGLWRITDAAAAISASFGAGWHALYHGNPNLESYRVGVDARWLESGTTSPAPAYGLIVCHDDRMNRVSAWMDIRGGMLWMDWVVGGQAGRQGVNLPAGFDATQFHRIEAKKAGDEFAVSLDGTPMIDETLAIRNGSAGVATEDTRAEFRNFRVY